MGSTQFGIALALTRGSNGLKDYWDGYKDKDVHALSAHVTLEKEPEFGVGGRQSVATVTTKDGRVVSYRQEEPRGEPTNPLTNEQLERKFVSTAGLVLGDAQVAEMNRRLHKSRQGAERQAALQALTVAPDKTPALRAA